MRFQRSRVKKRLIIFFDYQGVVHKEFVPQNTTVTRSFYKGVLERLLKRIARVRPEKFKDRDFFILHVNAPAHKAVTNQQFLANTCVITVHHPPYSPDLSPEDYFMCSKTQIGFERGWIQKH